MGRGSWVSGRASSVAVLAVVVACARQPDVQATRGDTHSLSTPATHDLRPTTDERRTILFIGTSLTAGLGLEPDSAWPQQIGRMIDSAGLPYAIVNAGVSGETSAGLLSRVTWLMRQPADLIVIETGANDGLRGVPVSGMRANIQSVITRIKAARPSARIALVQMEALPNLGAAYTRDFHDVFPELARANGVTLLPFLLDGVAGRRELNQADGVHPNYAGERIVARNVWKGLRQML